jgi:aspartyl-tRNA(Asn)/glutamyl-tRNA(Gln) amidotransferase subunit A
MPPPHTLDAVAIAADVRAGSRSAIGVVEATLDRIGRLDPQFNSFTTILADRARGAATRIDARIAAKQDVGPLAGVPFAVKNLFDVAGVTTIAGSAILADTPPAKRDAFAVARLEAAGAVLVGALNMDEFAYGFTTENAHYGATRNPHDPGRIAGGSSGGSAAAVAAGLVPLTLGTDTNGSVRVPAALCGVFGLKPSFGRLSRTGIYPFVDSLDHVGLFARSVRDLAVAYDILQSRDNEDPYQTDRPPELTVSALDVPVNGLRVGLLRGWFARYAAPGILAAVDRVAAALSSVGTCELEYSDVARAAAFCITAAEAGTRFLPMLRARAAEFDPATRSRLMAGAMLPASVLNEAYNIRRDYVRSVDDLFETVDVLLAPTTPWTAPLLGEAMMVHCGETLPVRASLGLYTQPISFAGMPVVVVPVHRDGEMPAGVQIITPRWREDRALGIAAALERAAIVSAPIAKRASL